MKFSVITLGCKVNEYESNYMKESLVNNGFLFCDKYIDSQIIIINTCTVTNTSDKKCLKMVHRVKRENPKAILVVCGCSVQYDMNLYKDLGINILIGNTQKSKIVTLINDYLKFNNNYVFIDNNRKLPFEDMMISDFDQVRAYIKVQDGCNNFCSYCIIPYVRGDIRSKNFDLIIKEAKILADKGFKEIVLTGIHTGSYFDNGKDLSDLIDELSKIEGINRIRLSSVEITELNDKFLELLKNNKVLCNHLHIPLQSGSDEILHLMHRKYDTKYFLNKISLIRQIRPDISITTDVIVGFPKETDELFTKAYEFCKKIKFAKIHVFPYSDRKGTAASYMDGKIPENIKKERCRKLIALSSELEKEYYDSFTSKNADVLIEKCDGIRSYGHTSNYLNVVLDEVLEVGKIYIREIK